MAAEVEQRDEGGKRAVSDTAQSEAHAVRSDAGENAAEWKMLAGSDGDRRLDGGPEVCDGADDDGEDCDGGEAPVSFHHDAQRSAERQSAVSADSVVGDDLR